MGQRISLSCEKCGYQKIMSVGIGLMSRNPDIIASCLNQEEAAEWQKLCDNQKISFFHAEQKVFYCENCNELSDMLSVDLDTIDGEKITLGNKCGNCNRKLREIKQQEKMACPICKDVNLEWKHVRPRWCRIRTAYILQHF